MSVSVYKLKNWINMIRGKSLLHVNQGLGKCFDPHSVKGYFNDMTEKVILDKETLENLRLPEAKTNDGKTITFATTIFQYGLGAYDLFLLEQKKEYLQQFLNCVSWALNNQDDNGGWNVSAFAGESSPYGAMAQGEGASLLLRAYVYFNDDIYLNAARKAIDLMIESTQNGGTAFCEGDKIYLLEFVNKSCVLNGWIFALFGLHDYILLDNSETYSSFFEKTITSLCNCLCEYDLGYWSLYDNSGMIASPFYHKLHIAQLDALYQIYPNDSILITLNKFREYSENKKHTMKAVVKKCIQKLFE